MILVACSVVDDAAAKLAEEIRSFADAAVLTCRDLTLSKCAIHCPNVADSLVTLEGRNVAAEEILGVINLMPAVFPDELYFFLETEREYQAAEFYALLTFFLGALSCPVVNRPTAASLVGSYAGKSAWIHVARRLGIPVADLHLDSANWAISDAEEQLGASVETTCLHGEVISGNGSCAIATCRLAERRSEWSILRARFSKGRGRARAAWGEHCARHTPRCDAEQAPAALPTMGWIVMIFLWGLLQDDTFRSVHDCLLRRGVEIAFVNHALIGRTRVEFSGLPEPDYRLSCGKRVYELNSMSAAYLRPYDHRLYEDEKTSDRKVSPPDVVHHLLMSWAEHTTVMTINRPSAEATNQSKLYQAMLICRAGLRVPASLVSNDVEEIERFTAEQGRVIYKSMSSVRSVVRETRYTVTSLAWCYGSGDVSAAHPRQKRARACSG